MCLLWILCMYTVPRGGTGVASLLWFAVFENARRNAFGLWCKVSVLVIRLQKILNYFEIF
jgi:hypothetical protein